MCFGQAEGDYMKAANRTDIIIAIVGAGLEVGLVAAGVLKPIVLWITWVVVANIGLLIHAKGFYDRDNKFGTAMCLIAMICCTVIGVVLV